MKRQQAVLTWRNEVLHASITGQDLLHVCPAECENTRTTYESHKFNVINSGVCRNMKPFSLRLSRGFMSAVNKIHIFAVEKPT